MDAVELGVGVTGILIPSYLIYRQNRILQHANDLTAHTLGPDAPKEPINMVPLRHYWPMWGMLLMMLGIWVVVGFDYYDRHDIQTSISQTLTQDAWNHFAFKQIWGASFDNQTVKLDGYEYVNSTFDNVTFDYEGTAPSRFTNCHITPHPLGKVGIQSKNPIVNQTMIIMAGIARASSADIGKATGGPVPDVAP